MNNNAGFYKWIKMVFAQYGRTKCIISIMACIILIVSFGYNDVIIINRHVISLWKSIVQYRNPFHFYDVCYYDTLTDLAMGRLAVGAMYDFLIYVIEGIWGAPLFLLSLISNQDVPASWYGILWGKLLHILFFVYDGYLVFRIARFSRNEEKSIIASVYFLTSIISCSSVYIIGQCDSIVIMFMLLGVLNINMNRKAPGLIYSTIAISLKTFALFSLIVVMLVNEKRIFTIIKQLLPCGAFILLIKSVFRPLDTEADLYRSDWLQSHIKMLFENKLPFVGSWTPAFPLLVVLVMAVCFVTRDKTYEKSVIAQFAIYYSMFLAFEGTPYWYLYMMPFYCIVLTMAEEGSTEISIIAFVGEASLVLAHFIKFHWCYDVQNVNRSLVGSILGHASTEKGIFRFSNLVEHTNWMVFGTFYAIYVVCFFVVGIVCYKRMRGTDCGKTELPEESDANRGLIERKITIRILFSYIPLVIYFANRISSL